MFGALNKFTIRVANETDVPSIVRVWVRYMDFHKIRDPQYTITPDAADKQAAFMTKLLASKDALLIVAEKAGCVAGFCVAEIQSRPPIFKDRLFGNVIDLAVDEAYRRRGLGEAMFRKVQEWLRERGIRRMDIRVVAANEVARSFWTKMGFKTYMEVQYLEF